MHSQKSKAMVLKGYRILGYSSTKTLSVEPVPRSWVNGSDRDPLRDPAKVWFRGLPHCVHCLLVRSIWWLVINDGNDAEYQTIPRNTKQGESLKVNTIDTCLEGWIYAMMSTPNNQPALGGALFIPVVGQRRVRSDWWDHSKLLPSPPTTVGD